MNLSSFSLKVLTASLVLASTTGLAFAKNYKAEANYKGEPVYKGEVPCPVPPMLKDGFYLGIQGGYDAYRVRESINAMDPDDDSSLTANPVISSTGWVGGLFIGYGRYLTDMFYLAGELYGNVSGAEQSWNITANNSDGTVDTYNNKVETNGSWGLAILPGIKLNDGALGYVRLGYNWVNLKGTESAAETLGGATTGSVSTSKSQTSNGWNFGLGIEALVWDNWSVRTEYNHIYLNSFTSSFGTKFNPSDNQFLVGVNYHFA